MFPVYQQPDDYLVIDPCTGEKTNIGDIRKFSKRDQHPIKDATWELFRLINPDNSSPIRKTGDSLNVKPGNLLSAVENFMNDYVHDSRAGFHRLPFFIAGTGAGSSTRGAKPLPWTDTAAGKGKEQKSNAPAWEKDFLGDYYEPSATTGGYLCYRKIHM